MGDIREHFVCQGKFQLLYHGSGLSWEKTKKCRECFGSRCETLSCGNGQLTFLPGD